MNWKLPNQLTVGRVGLAAAFFVLLGLWEAGSPAGVWLLNAAFVVYIVAGISDILDGYIARRYKLETAFGRIVDPFVDKVLVVGAFVMLTGRNFAIMPGMEYPDAQLPGWVTGGMLTGVQAWMVVAILAREFIVSAVRGFSESQGTKFPATPVGKVKMFIQSVTICTILFQLANVWQPLWAVWVKAGLVWLTVGVTVFSGFVYVGRSRKLMVATDGQ
ncbi:MAG: CDP-alcohol phosphatidyltransferase family protein [Phycisphaerae bacterium]